LIVMISCGFRYLGGRCVLLDVKSAMLLASR
jgi:hypothetical protein